MDQQERERDRGRTSRASSTSSLGREVRCACQFFQSDSLLPERRAMIVRPSSRNAAQPSSPKFRTSGGGTAASPANSGDHEYEPIGTPLIQVRTMTPISSAAPVVRIIDTDVAPVADSDDSIDLRGRFTPGPILEGNDLILPLDGQIEDSAMEARELAGGGDTSEELESPQQLQDRLEERFFNATTPCTESRTDGEVNTSQVDSSVMEELPLRRGARGLPQRLRSQAGKLRSRLKGIQRPNFSIPINRLRSNKTRTPSERTKSSSEKTKSSSEKTRTSSEKTRSSSEKTRSSSDKRSTTSERTRNSGVDNKLPKTTDKRSRMERIRSSLPDRPKFNFPDRSKFHLPERPKFNIKKPNIKFPTLGKSRNRAPSLGDVPRQRSTESNSGSRRNIFDFSTYPRLFDKKSKTQGEYATSSPNASRAQSTESSTLPRAKKTAPLGPRWAQRFTDIKFADDDDEDGAKTVAERSKPWRRPSLEEPRLSLRPQDSIEGPESLPWEDSDEKKRSRQIEELPYEDDEPEEPEIPEGRGLKLTRRDPEDSYDDETPRIDPRLYGDQDVRLDKRGIEIEELNDDDDESVNAAERAAYRASFMPVDPRIYKQRRVSSDPEDAAELEVEDDEPLSSEGIDEDISARSDRELQQSSGSSCDRRRRGVIEEIDSDEFFLREKGISEDDMNVGKYLTSEIRDALRTPTDALAHEVHVVSPQPPRRPARTRSMRKHKIDSVESNDTAEPPEEPKRDNRHRSFIDYDYDEDLPADNGEDSISRSRHRVVYHAESAPLDLRRIEPLDDIVVVKPIRRKSKSSLRSQSLRRSESLAVQPEEVDDTMVTAERPPTPPRRRKRIRAEESRQSAVKPAINGISSCNGHHTPALMRTESQERVRAAMTRKSTPPTSRENLRTVVSRLEHTDVNSSPPVPPKRSSRSRGASVVPDDDRTSHGAESIPSIGYTEDDIPQDDDDNSRLDYPGYAVIDKREKPPRPPPPRKRRDDKFATAPRSGTVPGRPQRGYSTLRTARSRSPTEVAPPTVRGILDGTPYEELDSEDDEHRDLRSGVVVSKIQGRPLPAPPRPPRIRRDRTAEESLDISEGATEAFASTQTDPLPDDMVIEEEVTQAKLIVAPSRSGSQILVSTERVPSPTCRLMSETGKSSSQGVLEGKRASSPTVQHPELSRFVTEPAERSVSQVSERHERSLSPLRKSTAPVVPPLPAHETLYHDDLEEEMRERGRRERETSRSKSPSLPKERFGDRHNYEMAEEQRIQSQTERIRLEEELDRARRLHAALLSNETLKIASLEVGDLKVDRLSVANLEAHKISASEIDALVVSATELSNEGATGETPTDLQPTLLRELIAIRSQLELANALQDGPRELQCDGTMVQRKGDERRIREIGYTTVHQSQPALLQLDQVSRSMETRAIFSSVGSSRESSPQPTIAPTISAPAQPARFEVSKNGERNDERGRSSSRSPSPGRTSPSGLVRQTTSPVKSLPPSISVTPDTPDVVRSRVETSAVTRPQRAVLSFARENEELSSESMRERSQSPHRPTPPPRTPTTAGTQYIAFSTSQIPPEFFALASPTVARAQTVDEPGIADLARQLLGALSVAGKRAMRHFVGYIVNRIGQEETDTKVREVELALCALLLIIAGLLIVCFSGPRTVTHHHHWDYFNPPRL